MEVGEGCEDEKESNVVFLEGAAEESNGGRVEVWVEDTESPKKSGRTNPPLEPLESEQ